jgi:erythritol/L-threitol dehydrogenase
MNDMNDVPRSMKSVVCHGPEDYRLEELPTPQPGPVEVLVKTLATGICASDIKCYHGAPLFWGDADRPAYCQPPVTPGHEFVGEVVALGEGAGEHSGLAVGDVAVSEQIVPCGNCRFCRTGHYWMCQPHDIYGFHQNTQGAWADYMKFPANAISYKVPAEIDPLDAVFVEPLACSIHAVNRGDITTEDVVVIAGCGPLGLGMVAAAKQKGPRMVIALDLSDDRLTLATETGADLTLNPSKVDAVDEVRALTDGYGCDVYIEATGAPASVVQGLHMVRKLGTFVEFSVFGQPVSVDWTIIGDTKELNIHGAHLSPHTYSTALQMIAEGRLPLDKIISHRLPLDDFETGIELGYRGTESLKVTLTP